MQTQLAATVGAAQRDALRFAGKLPANAWRPSHSRRWLRWGVPLCLAGAALLLLLCEVLAVPRPLDRAASALRLLRLAVHAGTLRRAYRRRCLRFDGRSDCDRH